MMRVAIGARRDHKADSAALHTVTCAKHHMGKGMLAGEGLVGMI